MLKAGCGALANFAMDDKNEAVIRAKGGIETVVRAMGAHESSAGVQHVECRGCGC